MSAAVIGWELTAAAQTGPINLHREHRNCADQAKDDGA